MSTGQAVSVFEKLVEYSLDLHCIIGRNGSFQYINAACIQILGYSPHEMVGRQFKDFVRPLDLPALKEASVAIETSSQLTAFENCYLHKNGHEVPLEWSASWVAEDEAYYCVGRSATEKKAAIRQLREKEELFEALVEYGADMAALINEEGVYTYVGGSIKRILGYEPEELVGKSAFSFIHPEDVPLAQEKFQSLLDSQEYIKLDSFRFKAANGEWKWTETYVSNQFQNPSVRALVVSSRDISEQTQNRLNLLESEQKYRNLFEKNPDAIFHQTPEGNLNEVNQAFYQILGFKPEEVINQPVSSFMPPESAALSIRYFKEALLGGTMRFDLELAARNGDRKVFDMIMYPLSVNGDTVGVETIAKDITPMVRAYETIQKQAQKFNTILESFTDTFFTLDKELRFTFINSEFEQLLALDKNKSLGKTIGEVFPEALTEEFYQHFQLLKAKGQAVTFETFLPGKEIWLGVKFFPAEDGISVHMLDITRRVNYQRELSMLSLVASKTTNGVVIMDADGLIQWVNQGFTNLNGYSLEDALGKTPSDLLQGPSTDPDTARRIFEKYQKGEPFSEEVLNFKKTGEEFWVKIDVSPVKDNTGKIIRFIAIQTDITLQKKSDESQAQLTRDLYRQNRDLQQFTYIVSHNLRAPVANVIGLTRFLSVFDKNSENFDVALRHLDKSVASIDAVLKDLNEILSIGGQKDTVSMESIDLRRICQEAVESLRDSLDAYEGNLDLDIPGDTFVFGNKAYLYSIFHNLLSNAIKYRSPERPLKISIRAVMSTQWVAIFLTDNGLGFDEEKAGDKVFKLYKRFHKNIEGRGLGLFLVKTQVTAIGGEIEVSSVVNVGTRFLIHLKPGNAPDTLS
ncbi:PAS domain S-box protein [Rufibacter soli]